MRLGFTASILCIGVVLSGCMNNLTEPTMSNVMSSCENEVKFSSYNSCIQTNYKKDPGFAAVKAFFAMMNSIEEDWSKKRISEVKARAQAYKAYMETVGAHNNRITSMPSPSYSSPTTCYSTGGYGSVTTTCF